MLNLEAAPDWLVSSPIAHRGYHDVTRGRAENSLSAFKAAADAGFAIECDLQISKTGEPVVFHDPVLGRMTRQDGAVRDHTPEQLASMRLLDTDDGIRTLEDHLQLISGRVPLVLELKGIEQEDAGFVEGVAAVLTGYSGNVCVMSFDHWICAQFKELLPDVPRGLTAEGGDDTYDHHLKAMTEYDLQFVSYGIHDLPCRFISDIRAAKLPVITWTVRNSEQAQKTYKFADQMTFEGFDPNEMPDARD